MNQKMPRIDVLMCAEAVHTEARHQIQQREAGLLPIRPAQAAVERMRSCEQIITHASVKTCPLMIVRMGIRSPYLNRDLRHMFLYTLRN
jgi:hypothetical protein